MDNSKAPSAKGYYSYPSRQRRQGPAPLASFEDLPSDEQHSPDAGNGFDDCSPDDEILNRALDVDSRSLVDESHTVTPTNVLSPDVGSAAAVFSPDASSEHTVTPVGIAISPPAKALDEECISCDRLKPKFADTQKGSDRKESECSLQVPHSGAGSDAESNTPSPDPKRKGSWTNIFFRGRSRSKSPSHLESPQKSPMTEEPNKKKKGFLSFFKVARKSPSPDVKEAEIVKHDVPDSSTRQERDSSTPRVSVTDTSDNGTREELMISMHPDENEPKESQQDIIGIIESEKLEAALKQNGDAKKSEKPQELNTTMPEPLPAPNLARRHFKKRSDTFDDEVQSLPEILPSSRSKEKDLCKMQGNIETVATIEHQQDDEKCHSSESELDVSEKSGAYKKKISEATEDEYEAANLLTQDSVDYDESVASEYKFEFTCPSSVQLKAKKERLEVTTIPVDRPRSTTPINIAPLEAFIKSATTSPDPKMEKIKLSLPGDQFLGTARAKSPRKSNPQIWLDFCEKGLHSPKTSRKPKNSITAVSSTAQTNDAFTPVVDSSSRVMSPLTPVTPLEEEEKWTFADNFDPSRYLNGQGNRLSTECNKCDCLLGKKGSNEVEGATGENTPIEEKRISLADEITAEEQPLVSPNPCSCECHKRVDFASSIWRQGTLQKQDRVLSASSDISSASSRLIGSTSSSKCSLAEEADAVSS
ncbi:muscle M-line assembly protein unc-89-like protein [Dinothrombium tinctorium]|uniref:Muscle M-line assembly protein unc-89-like protein n=1 Tax=Dinothrombium tinctorium TaxID=1965070 RepID=A0A3S4RG77_9ACAR|nr:muscle M-line assembly protein unc-89-like protein [Dinothrombium tinctorium]